MLLTFHIGKKNTKKKVKQQYDALEGTEKEALSRKVAEMEESIADTLSPKNFGTTKYDDAWKAWSRNDRVGLKTLRKTAI
jgi:hypothetical protein